MECDIAVKLGLINLKLISISSVRKGNTDNYNFQLNDIS